MNSKAVVFAGVGQVEIWDVDIPSPGDAEVLVRTTHTGMSGGTDGWMIRGRYAGVRDRYPFVYGYQRVGVIEEVGPGVAGLTAGDRVFSGLARTRLGDAGPLGAEAGAYTGLGCLPANGVLTIPEGVSGEDASFAGLAAVPMVGRDLIGVSTGELVVVLGQGMVGQMAAQICRIRGAKVITTDVIPQRVRLSGKLSADIALDAVHDDIAAAVTAIQPEGADLVIDCTGRSDMFPLILEIVRGACSGVEKPGRACLQGYYPDPIEIDADAAHRRRLKLAFPCGFDKGGVQEALRFMAEGRLTVRDLITHSWPASDAPEAFDFVLENPADVMATYLDWT